MRRRLDRSSMHASNVRAPYLMFAMIAGVWFMSGRGEATSVSLFDARRSTENADAVVIAHVREATDHQVDGEAWSEGSVEIVEVLKGELPEARLHVWAKQREQPTEEPWEATGTHAAALEEYSHTILRVGGPGILFLGYDPQTKRWLYRFGVRASKATVNAVRSGDSVTMPPPYWISEDQVPSWAR